MVFKNQPMNIIHNINNNLVSTPIPSIPYFDQNRRTYTQETFILILENKTSTHMKEEPSIKGRKLTTTKNKGDTY